MKQANLRRIKYDDAVEDFKEASRLVKVEVPNILQATLWFSRKKELAIKYEAQLNLFGDPSDVWETEQRPSEIRQIPFKEAK